MNCVRIGMVAATFFVSAALASAQSISLASQLAAQGLVDQVRPTCSDDCEGNWYVRAMQHGVAAWQRVRAVCFSNGAAHCCEQPVAQVGQARPGTVTFTPGTAKGSGTFMLRLNCDNGVCTVVKEAVPAQPACCGIKQFTQLTCPLGFTTAPCCCSKACACCETCKPKAVTHAQPMQARTVPHPVAPPVQTWTMPVPPPPGARVVVGLPTSTAANTPAHFVTPELEAHCQRITHRDGQVILEGNVMMVCKKHAQPMRVEAQRVIVNMRDGSFTVDSANAVTPMTPVTGVLRTSGEMPMPMMMPTPAAPVQYRVIEVMPR